MGVFRSSIRLMQHSFFLEISLEAYQLHKELLLQLDDLKAAGGFEYKHEDMTRFIYHQEDEIRDKEDQIEREIIKVLVFLAMYCEAYIWDLAASILGDSYAKRYLDKLDPFGKWVVIPKLLFGKEIDTAHHGMGALKELILWRNDLVHSKSRDFSDLIHKPEKYDMLIKPLREQLDIKKLMLGIKALFTMLQEIDDQGAHHWRFRELDL